MTGWTRGLMRKIVLLAAGASLVAVPYGAAAQAADAGVSYSDVTARAGLAFRHQASKTSSKFLPETMGGGVALFDANGDRRLDVFFANGAKIDESMTSARQPDKKDPAYWNRLYLAQADGTFLDATEKAGLAGARYDFGAAAADYDNDGDQDLYVTGYGGNTLYRNNGNGTFADVTARSGTGAGGWSSSAGFFDADNDGDLDLFVARYLTWAWETNVFCGASRSGPREYCSPKNFPGITDILYRNNGDGTFTDVSKAAGVANPEGKGLGVAFNDYNNDGRTDVFVANDGVRQFLYRNNGDGTFTDVALDAGVGYTETGSTFAGMGTDFDDYDNDGLPDILATALSNETYALFRNNGDETFTYVTNTSGVGEATVLMSGWGAKFMDYDNDGRKDVFVAQSHVLDTVEKSSPALRYLQPLLMLRNAGTRFVNASVSLGPAFTLPLPARGAAVGDLDDDGDLDLVVANLDRGPSVLRNDGASRRNWLTLELEGRKSNRDAIGARVKVVGASGRAQYGFVSTASSYQSANDRRVHFGLGDDATVASIEIRWPGGGVQTVANVKANQILRVTEAK